MGRLNFQALRVRQSALSRIAGGSQETTPRWSDTLLRIPPASVLVRPLPREHALTTQRVKTLPGKSKPQTVIEARPSRSAKSKKASRMFQPVKMEYEEDLLREEFFRDHPWELARPRAVLETDGRDHWRQNWSKLQQSQRRVDGESVIQRQLHLLHTVPDITKEEAYDIARREFYKVRLQEDVERRIAQEEARATGAYFGPTLNSIGMKIEGQIYERWKDWATTEITLAHSGRAAFAGTQTTEAEVASSSDSGENSRLKAPEPEVLGRVETVRR